MKKLAILLVTIFLILSGCVDKTKTGANVDNGDKDINKNVDKENNVSKGDTIVIANTNVSVNGANTNNLDVDNDIYEWCSPEDKIVVQTTKGQEEFTIKGITTYQGREVCQAEQIYDNGKKVRYFSKDGKFVSEIADSSGSGNVSAYSEASVNVTK